MQCLLMKDPQLTCIADDRLETLADTAESMASDVKEWIKKTVDAAVHLKLAELKQHILAAYHNAKAIPLGEIGLASYKYPSTSRTA